MPDAACARATPCPLADPGPGPRPRHRAARSPASPRRRSLRRPKRSFVNRRLRARRRSLPPSSSSTRDRSLAFSWRKPLTVRSNSRTAEADRERFDSFRASPSRARARPCNDRQWFAAQRASIPSRRSQDNSSRNAAHPPHDAPPGDSAAAPRDSTPSKHANSKPTAMPPVYSYPSGVSSFRCSITPTFDSNRRHTTTERLHRHDHRHRGQTSETQELFDADKRPGEKCGLDPLSAPDVDT